MNRCFRGVFKTTKTTYSIASLVMFTSLVILLIVNVFVCNNSYFAAHMESANCKVVQRELRKARDIVFDRIHALSESKPLAHHAYDIMSILFIAFALFNGYSQLVHNRFFCDCICRRILSKSGGNDTPSDDTFRGDTDSDTFSHTTEDIVDDLSVDRSIERTCHENTPLKHLASTVPCESHRDESYLNAAMGTSTTCEGSQGKLLTDAQPEYAQRVTQSAPMSEYPGVYMQPSQTTMLVPLAQPENVAVATQEDQFTDKREELAQESQPTDQREELGQTQEPMEVEDGTTMQSDTTNNLRGTEEVYDREVQGEPMEVEESSQSLKKSENDNLKNSRKRASPEHEGEGRFEESVEKKQKVASSVNDTSTTLCVERMVEEHPSRLDQESDQEYAHEGENGPEENAQDVNFNSNEMPLTQSSEVDGEQNPYRVFHTQVADNVDPPTLQNEQTVESPNGSSNDNPVSLLTDDEQDEGEHDYHSPSIMSNVDRHGSSGKTTSRQPNTLRNVSKSDSSFQKGVAPKRALGYNSGASTSNELLP